MDPPRRNLPPSRRKIDVDKNSSNQTEFRMPFLITGQAIDWYRSLNIEDMLNAASPGIRRNISYIQGTFFNIWILDTTPTEHTLRLLSLSDFYDSSIGKIKLKKKITAAASAFMSVFGKKEIQQQRPSNELDQLKERMEKVLNVFSEVDTTEFVIFTCVGRKEQTRVLRLIQDDTKHLTRDILNSCCYKKQLHGWYELYSDN
ncbi:BnaC01g20420D [Brassica napus]|uniref:BnaC01g20420D protein n=1 Tax=Brassica napus TaxID=3708 RepID=A0A078G184_BRANA|nr:BnaC01g20420D [Brassica napus]